MGVLSASRIERFASSSWATTAVTTAVAMLEPLRRTYRPDIPGRAATRSCGCWLYSVPLLVSATSRSPGATTSGLAKPSYQDGPRELYGATTSSPRPMVPNVRAAPTVMADGAFPGDVMPA